MILNKTMTLEKYPLRFIIVRNLLNIALFCTGAMLMSFVGNWLSVVYPAYCFCTIIWLLKFRCSYCYYYGKRCASGFGTASSYLFAKGAEEYFSAYNSYSLPLILVIIAPVAAGGIHLFRNFSFSVTALLLVFIMLFLFLSKVYYIRYGCDYCKQAAKCQRGMTISDGNKAGPC
jgi:hypothetical protein